MTIHIDRSVLELFLPEGTLDWFDAIKGEKTETEVRITLEEKNVPPVAHKDKNKRILSKGFTDITINDFPIRGKRAALTFRRRRWQVEETGELLTRDLKLCFPHTQLEQQFAAFLKAGGGG